MKDSLPALGRQTILDAVFDRMAEGVVVVDSAGRVLFANSAAERLLGAKLLEQPAEQWAQRLGLLCSDLETPLADREFPLSVSIAGQESGSLEAYARPAEGGEGRWLSFESARVPGPDGATLACALFVRDIDVEKRLGAKQSQAARLLEALLEYLPDNVYFKDAQSRFLKVSRRLAEQFGAVKKFEVEGKTDFDYFTEEHARPAFEDEQELMRTGIPIIGKEEFETWQDGRETWASSTKMPLRDATGKVVGTFGISRDITAQKRAEEALRESDRRTRLIVDNAHDAIVAMDESGAIIDWNPQAEIMFGWTRQEAMGRVLADTIIPPRYREAHERGLQKYLETGEGPVLNKRIEISAMRRDGTEMPVELSISPIQLKQGHIFSAFIHDISERKLAEEAMRKGKEAAEAANRAKSEFLANMSHEIRTPMNGIIGMTELALDTKLSREQREYLSMVKASGEALLAVINDILDFSKIEARKLELETIDFRLRDVVGDTMKGLALRSQQKGIELACHIPPDAPESLIGDPGRLSQILVNLVGNAIKFTDEGEVVVDVEIESQSAHEVALHFTVTDTGIGIPPDKQRLIFEAFSQVDGSTTRKYGGTGLGLTISSQLVDMMGGRIWVESQPGQGSVFHFVVRYGLGGEQPAPAKPARAGSLSDLRVLVVDDNATNRRILQEMLTNWGLRPTLAESGQEALAAMQRAVNSGDAFPLILLDCHMPEMDGFELAEEIQKTPAFAGVTLVMLTSAGKTGDMGRCRQLGISAYVMKPIKQSELLDSIFTSLGISLRQAESPDDRRKVARGQVQSLRILLAEDNLVNQRLAVRLLEKQGHSIIVANNGQEAVAALEQSGDIAADEAASEGNGAGSPGQRARPFDVVLMDVQMPELGGFEATAIIREREKKSGGHIPIIAMTAHAMKGDRERCLESGMDGYVAKPIQPAELFAAIRGAAAPVKAAAPTPAVGEAIDKAEALERLGGDHELLKEIAGVYMGEVEGMLGQIRQSIEKQDAPTLRRAAHTLKGALGAFVAKEAAAAAHRLENLGAQAEFAPAPSALADLEKVLAPANAAIGAIAQEPVS